MLFTFKNKIFEKPLYSSYGDVTSELAKNLEEKNYVKSLYISKNLNLVRTFAINRCKLTSDYILFEQE